MRLFWERGYERTSITDLTKELGIAAPSLYAAFGGKRALFEEAVARYEGSPASVTTVGLAGESPRRVLQIMLDQAAREYTIATHPRGCLVNSEPALAVNRAQNRELTAARLRELAHDARSGSNAAPSNESDTLAAFAHVLLAGLSSYARDGASEEQLRRVAELALRAVPE